MLKNWNIHERRSPGAKILLSELCRYNMHGRIFGMRGGGGAPVSFLIDTLHLLRVKLPSFSPPVLCIRVVWCVFCAGGGGGINNLEEKRGGKSGRKKNRCEIRTLFSRAPWR